MSREHHDDHRAAPPLDRRDFLRLAGAGLALAGLDGCARMPARHILPYVDNRPELTPGVGQYYATAMCVDGFATGLIVESHAGRPTKVEGNPQHPASLGASSAMHQASILQLYDPDRARTARIGSTRAEWSAIAALLAPAALRARVGANGERLRLLIEPSSSILEEELLARLLAVYPEAQLHTYAPLAPVPATRSVVQHFDIASADVIVAVDSDFLASGPFHLRYARQFADRRRLASPSDPMNRLYVIESSVTPTGAAADHRFAIRPREIGTVLRALLDALGAGSAVATPVWLAGVARDLAPRRGRAVVIGGPGLSDDDRALVDAINDRIGAAGRTTWSAPSPLIGRHVPLHTMNELVDAMHAGAVDTLVVIGGNPSYAAPAALDFRALVRAVPNAGYLGMYENETARDARWFVPMSHYLEAWGDARAYDGTVSLVQPLVDPLYRSLTPAEMYATLSGVPVGPEGAYDLLRQSWAKRGGGSVQAWSETLQRGFVAGSAITQRVSASGPAIVAATPAPDSLPEGTVDVIYALDPKIHDGAYANNGWLQELPAPITKLTWGNAALISPQTARRVGVGTGDSLTLSSGGQRVAVAAFVLPGHADDVVTLHFGYGRAGGESLARGIGANAYALWPRIGVRVQRGVHIAAGGRAPAFALAQTEPAMSVGDPVRRTTLAEYRATPSKTGDRPGRVLSLYPEPVSPASAQHAANQWAMTIDLGTCIGCGACVVACQAENNIPVVGADEVRNGREMQWIRIDRYFAERERGGAPETLFQPMLCQQCEHAPCEYVCPVEATVHSDDGLNEMVYNRCVGTRFCSNNCPYKVRHFNWYDYNAHLSETELMGKNPNVTVRERGVMEKCTFCVQRIREAEIAAGREGRTLRGSEVQTACQQACPTNAIVFGSLTEPDSEMARRRQQPRAYSALGELGTEPRVRYLSRVRNANPELGTDA